MLSLLSPPGNMMVPRGTGSDGSFTATGTFPPGSEGIHAERVIVGAAQSNEVRFRITDQ